MPKKFSAEQQQWVYNLLKAGHSVAAVCSGLQGIDPKTVRKMRASIETTGVRTFFLSFKESKASPTV